MVRRLWNGSPYSKERAKARVHCGLALIDLNRAEEAILPLQESLKLYEALDLAERSGIEVDGYFTSAVHLRAIYGEMGEAAAAMRISLIANRRVADWFSEMDGPPDENDWRLLIASGVSAAEAVIATGNQHEADKVLQGMHRQTDRWFDQLSASGRRKDARKARRFLKSAERSVVAGRTITRG